MNTKLAGSRDLRHNRTDWRQHLATRGNVQQRNMGDPRAMPPMNYPAPPPNYPPPQPPPTYQPQYNSNYPPSPYQPQYNPNYPPHPNQNPQQLSPAVMDGEEIPSDIKSNVSFIPFPKDQNGNPILPPELQNVPPNPAYVQQNSNQYLTNTEFVVPNYSETIGETRFASTDSVSLDSNKLDELIKEIKSMKKAINKLTRDISKVIVQNSNEPQTNDIQS